MSKLTVIHGDCLAKLHELPAESVQCVVTSPPYDDLRTYGGGSWNFEGMALELSRVLCGGGVICWNVGDSVVGGSETLTSAKQKIYFREVVGFRIHDTMIYEKTNFAHPEKARYHQTFEYVFILSKGAPKTFNPIKDKPNIWAGGGTFGKNTARQRDGTMKVRTRNIISEFGMRGNVWRGNTRGQEELCSKLKHPAMMPKWLARDLILSWSNIGDMILDPFAGSGTTGEIALGLSRDCTLIELNGDYLPLIAERTGTSENYLPLHA